MRPVFEYWINNCNLNELRASIMEFYSILSKETCGTDDVQRKLDVHESVHRDTTVKVTNQMHYID